MILGKVTGSVWGAKQVQSLAGYRIVSVRPLVFPNAAEFREDVDERFLSASLILAVDRLGADMGELVLVSIGSRVRDLVAGEDCPTKNCIIAIVDRAVIA